MFDELNQLDHHELRRRGWVRLPERDDWCAWWAPKPGESSLQAVTRQMVWDSVVEGWVLF